MNTVDFATVVSGDIEGLLRHHRIVIGVLVIILAIEMLGYLEPTTKISDVLGAIGRDTCTSMASVCPLAALGCELALILIVLQDDLRSKLPIRVRLGSPWQVQVVIIDVELGLGLPLAKPDIAR